MQKHKTPNETPIPMPALPDRCGPDPFPSADVLDADAADEVLAGSVDELVLGPADDNSATMSASESCQATVYPEAVTTWGMASEVSDSPSVPHVVEDAGKT